MSVKVVAVVPNEVRIVSSALAVAAATVSATEVLIRASMSGVGGLGALEAKASVAMLKARCAVSATSSSRVDFGTEEGEAPFVGLNVQAEFSIHAFKGVNCGNEGIYFCIALADVSSDSLFDVGRMRSEMGLDQGTNFS